MTVDTIGTRVDGELWIEIAVWEDELLGTGRIVNATSAPRLVDVFVSAPGRERTVARRIIEQAVQWQRETEVKLRVEIRKNQEIARRLYEELGWTQTEGETSDQETIELVLTA